MAVIGVLFLGVLASLGGCQGEDVTFESVDALLREGRHEEAFESVRAALDRDATRSDLQMIYARMLVGRRDYYLALWPLREAARDPEFAIEALLLQATTQTSIGNPEAALDALGEVLELEPQNREAIVLQAAAHLAAMQLDLALEDADLLIELYPEDLEPRLTRVKALLLLERADEAGDALSELATRLAEDPDAHPVHLRAQVCAAEARFQLELGNPDAWFEKAGQCADEFPSDHAALKEILDVHAHRGEWEQTSQRLEAALAAAPHDRELRLLLSEQYRKLGDSAAAEQILREGIALHERERPQDWRSLYEHFWQSKDYAQALVALERMIELMPNPSTADLLTLGDTLIESGDLERAEEVAAQLEEGYRHLVMGRILIERGDFEGAREALTIGIRQWPNNAVARLLLGQVAASLGDLEEAMNQYIEAYRIDYGHNSPGQEKTQSAKEVGRIHVALGSFETAAEFLSNHIASNPADIEAYELLILAGARAGKGDFVASALQKLAALPRGFPRALAIQARLISEAEGPAAAVKTLRRWKPDLTLGENSKVLAVFLDQLALLDKHEEAIEAITRSITVRPDVATFHALRAQCLARAGRDAEEVIAEIGEAFRIDPQNHRALMVQGDLESKEGHLDAALESYRRAADLDRSASEPGLAEGRLLARHSERRGEARARLEQLLVEHPLESRAATTLALLDLEDESSPNLDDAFSWATRASKFSGALPLNDAAEAFFVLGRVHVARGAEADARASVEVALQLEPKNEGAQELLAQLGGTSGKQD
jgi:tetratricopeptide (TPR) repeat protein